MCLCAFVWVARCGCLGVCMCVCVSLCVLSVEGCADARGSLGVCVWSVCVCVCHYVCCHIVSGGCVDV